jgi:hypothetical protein
VKFSRDDSQSAVLSFVVILNVGPAAGPVKDPCISSLFLLLPVPKSVSSLKISVEPSVFKQVLKGSVGGDRTDLRHGKSNEKRV